VTAVGWLLARGGVYPRRWMPDFTNAVAQFVAIHHRGIVEALLAIGLVACVGWICAWWRLEGIANDSLDGPAGDPDGLTIHDDRAMWALDRMGCYLIGGPWGLALYGDFAREWPWPVIAIPPMPPGEILGWLAQRPIQPAPPWDEVERFVRHRLK